MNNTANAGRIVRSRNGRKILPAFLLTAFVAALATAAIPQKKKERRNSFGADQKKEVLQKPLGRYGRKSARWDLTRPNRRTHEDRLRWKRREKGAGYQSNIHRRGGHRAKSSRAKATYVGGAQSKAVYEEDAHNRSTKQESQNDNRHIANISAPGAGDYGADKRIFGEGCDVGLGLAKAGQLGLTQIAKAGSSAGAWLENRLGDFAREGTNGYWDPDASKWLFNRWNQATAAFTLEVYGHFTDDMRQASSQRMEQFISGVLGLYGSE